ncbi:MAG: DUF3892 domain-containing protein [Bacteroidetes bacterium]|nr:DUF3892 domain-containing protein [Bacteroidota bacterium]
MALYRISGVWKNSNNVITHYAFHTVNSGHVTRAEKVTKANAIAKLEAYGSSATTYIWNYSRAGWDIGENVQVVDGHFGKYLRSNPDKQITDNLGHLIDYDWIFP